MTLTNEELDKKIRRQKTCKNCKHSYLTGSWVEDGEHRCCEKFQYQGYLVNNKHDDIIVEDDEICDEYEGYLK